MNTCCCQKARAKRGVRRTRRGAIYDIYNRSDADRGGGAFESVARQHRAASGMEQGRHGALLGVRLNGGR
jgi:hypothetical protein